MAPGDKRQRIDKQHPIISIARQCELAGLPRLTYYGKPSVQQETPENLEFMRLIDELFTAHPFYGSRQTSNAIRRKGHKINRTRVQRLMRKMGLQSIAPKPNTSSDFCVSSLKQALRLYDHPEIFNTDQGSQYTGSDFTGVLKDHQITISMDGKGRAMDNIFIERLWRSVKYEEIYANEYQSVKDLRLALKRYFHFYNYERPHQSFDGQMPAEVYHGDSSAKMAA